MNVTLDDLRRYAVARSLFAPTTVMRAIARLGFVQADPIRAPARAQDLILRPRVAGYRAGDLEQRYRRLALEEDFFVNYGYLPRAARADLHPRPWPADWDAQRNAQARQILAFVASQGTVHPRQVEAAFAHGTTRNGFGGRSQLGTQLLDALHYRGWLRVAGRQAGVRCYALAPAALREVMAPQQAAARADALIDRVVGLYAPLPAASLSQLVTYLGRGAPQLKPALRLALGRARQRLGQAAVAGTTWYWPAGEQPAGKRWKPEGGVRLLAPFDPVVWDRRRFALFWDWEYRLEAYTPPARRERGYYALPLLWQGQAIGWANLVVVEGRLQATPGYVAGQAPAAPGFAPALAAELAAMARFLGVMPPLDGSTGTGCPHLL